MLLIGNCTSFTADAGAGSSSNPNQGTSGSNAFNKGLNAKNKKNKKLRSDTEDSTVGDEELRDNLSPLEKKPVSKKGRDLNSGFLGMSGMRDREYDTSGGYRSSKEP